MITHNGALATRRLQRSLRLGASAGLAIGLIIELLFFFFPELSQLSFAPTTDTALSGIIWAFGVAVIAGLAVGISAWVRVATRPTGQGGTLVIPGLIEVAVNGAATQNPDRQWGIFVDLSNIALGDGGAVDLTAGELERALDWIERTHDRLLVRQAYGDFSGAMHGSGDLGIELRRRGFTLAHMPRLQRGAEKNHSDIQLAVDAALIARARPDIGGYVIMGGDGDYTPLVLQLRTLGKQIHIISRERMTSAALLAQADAFVALEAISGRTAMAPTSLRFALISLRGALSGLASQSIATPTETLPHLLKVLGIDVTAFGFLDVPFFLSVMVPLNVLRVSETPQKQSILMPGDVAPGEDSLDRLLRAMGETVSGFAQRRQRPTLIQTLEAIWKADPSLDVTKTTPLVPIQVLNIAERLSLIGTERRPGEETRLVPGKPMA